MRAFDIARFLNNQNQIGRVDSITDNKNIDTSETSQVITSFDYYDFHHFLH